MYIEARGMYIAVGTAQLELDKGQCELHLPCSHGYD